MTLVVGIDPGATGYISATLGERIEFKKLPQKKQLIGKTHRSLIDFKALHSLLCRLKTVPGGLFVTVERQQPFERDGKSACFIMGGNYRSILNAIEFADIPFDVVSPVTWKNHFGLGKRPNETPPQAKQRAADLAAQLYPSIGDAIRKDKGFGLAESLLIGRFGAIKHGLMAE